MGAYSRLGNDLYSGRKSIDFVGRRWLWYALSGVIIAVAALGLGVKGLDFGIEFTGGAEFRVVLATQDVTQDTADGLRAAVAATGVDAASSPVVTTSGSEAILVQTGPLSDAESTEVVDAILADTGASAADLSQSEIGASWGQEVAKRSLIGLSVFLVLVVLFIWAYFREWKMSVAALVALVHDVLITVGIYALSGFEVTPATVTGVLTILGFSLYDTVVVFDKVRENTTGTRQSRQTYAQAANLAVNQTLVRSINTSLVALLPVGAILYVSVIQLGSGSLKDLSLALFVGMAAGTYSSIFVATPFLVQIKGAESSVREADRRAKARRRHDADRYATVPAAGRDARMEERSEVELEPEEATTAPTTGPVPTASSGAMGKGRVVPPAAGPVRPSASAARAQPTRQSRSRRGKK